MSASSRIKFSSLLKRCFSSLLKLSFHELNFLSFLNLFYVNPTKEKEYAIDYGAMKSKDTSSLEKKL